MTKHKTRYFVAIIAVILFSVVLMQNVFATSNDAGSVVTYTDLSISVVNDNNSNTHIYNVSDNTKEVNLKITNYDPDNGDVYLYISKYLDSSSSDISNNLYVKPKSGFAYTGNDKLKITPASLTSGNGIISLLISSAIVSSFVVSVAQYKTGAGEADKADYTGFPLLSSKSDFVKNPNYEFGYLIINLLSSEQLTTSRLYEINKKIAKFYCTGALNGDCNFPDYASSENKKINDFGDRNTGLLNYFSMINLENKPNSESDIPSNNDYNKIVADKVTEVQKNYSKLKNQGLITSVSKDMNLTAEETAVYWAIIGGESKFEECTNGSCGSEGIAQINFDVWGTSAGYNSLKKYLVKYKEASTYSNFAKFQNYQSFIKVAKKSDEENLVLGAAIFLYERDLIKSQTVINLDTPNENNNLAINTAFMSFYFYQQGETNGKNKFSFKKIPSFSNDAYSYGNNGLSNRGVYTSMLKLAYYLVYKQNKK